MIDSFRRGTTEVLTLGPTRGATRDINIPRCCKAKFATGHTAYAFEQRHRTKLITHLHRGIGMDSPSPKKSKKEKKEKEKEKEKERDEIIIPLEDLSPIASPLAQKKLLKKLHKTIKKASKARQVKRGVKEVVKGIRKGERGLLVLAADINPIDIISHLPVLAEEAQIPYVFVPSKEELGHASSTKRPTSCVMVCPDQKRKVQKGAEGGNEDDYREVYEECRREVEKLDTKIIF